MQEQTESTTEAIPSLPPHRREVQRLLLEEVVAQEKAMRRRRTEEPDGVSPSSSSPCSGDETALAAVDPAQPDVGELDPLVRLVFGRPRQRGGASHFVEIEGYARPAHTARPVQEAERPGLNPPDAGASRRTR